MRRLWVCAGFAALLACSACTSSSPPWTLDFAQREPWATVMEVVRIALCLVTAVAIVPSGFWVPRRGVWNVVAGGLATVVALVAFVSYFDFLNPNVRYQKFYHRHEFFHGYMGAKYFDELGYDHLYSCSIVAQSKLPERLRVQAARDMRDRTLKPASEIPEVARPELCRDRFTKERWQELERDVEFFASRAAGSYFAGMHKDSGYGKSPLWTLIAGGVAGVFGASDMSFLLLASFDVWLSAGMLVAVFWAFGWRVFLTATVFWATNAAATFYWTGGSYLHQLWLFSLVVSICCAKRRLPVAAGALLTASALLNPYVALLFSGVVLSAGVRFLRQRRIPKRFVRFGAGAVVALGLLVPASVVATGADAYATYGEKLVWDSQYPVTNQVGLSYLLSHDGATRMKNVRDNELADPFKPWRDARIEHVSARRPLQLGFVILIGAWTVWALWRTTSLWAAIPLSFPLFMTVMSPTCFYLSMAVVLALATHRRPVLAALLLLLVASTQVILVHVYFIDDRYALMTIPLYLAGLVVLCAHSWSWTLRSLSALTHTRPA